MAGAMDVLLIEDNPGDARLIEELLVEAAERDAIGEGAAPPEVRHVDRLADGVAVLDETVVDVVLLDLGLPDSRGIETLEAVREHSTTVPIVVLTGLDDETVGVQAVQRGAQEYLVKDELTPTLLGRSLRHGIERKKFERTQAALHDASRDLIQAESKPEVSRLILEAAIDVLDRRNIAIYLLDESANVLRPAAHTDRIEATLDGPPSLGPDEGGIAWRAFITGETTTLADASDDDVHPREAPLESGIWIPLGDHGVIVVVCEDGRRIDQRLRRLADHLAATAEAALDRVEREAALREHERELTRQNRRLERLDRVNRLIREIDQALVRATTREEIERAVCDLLTRDDQFAFAWIGEAVDDEGLQPRTWAGADRGYLDAVSFPIDAADGPPSTTAASTGRVTAVPNVAAGLGDAAWRRAALARDLQSVISVPLSYHELSYGVLTVFATDPDAFDTDFDEVFGELGETIANALNSVETREALLTDTVVELELAIQESDDLLGRLARRADCRIEYGGTVPQSDGTTNVFFSATGAPAEVVQEAAADVPGIQRLDLISESEDESRFEVAVSGSTIPSTLVECGAVARSITVTGSATRVVTELPNTIDVRTFIDRLETTYPDVELIARRDRERAERFRRPFEAVLAEQLTDRQLEILKTAHLSGYFEWPRERTGEEVAESLGITQPTFNGHLRAAERKLCTVLFEGSDSTDDPDQHT